MIDPEPERGPPLRPAEALSVPEPPPAAQLPAPLAFLAERIAPPEEVSLATLVATLWRGKLWLVLAMLVGLAASSAALLLITPKYTASMLLGATPDPTSTPGQSGGPAGGLARALAPSLAQGGDVPPRFLQLTELMFSGEIARRLDQRHALRRLAFPRRWDSEAGKWIEPGGLEGVWRQVQALFGRTPPTEPSNDELERFIERAVTLRDVTGKPMWEVRVRHETPALARDLASWVVLESDALLRTIEEKRLDENMRVILQRLSSTNVQEYRIALAGLLALQERQRMLISPDRPFAAEILQPPMVTAYPDYPPLGLVLALGPLLGLMLGIAALLLFAGRPAPASASSPGTAAGAPPPE